MPKKVVVGSRKGGVGKSTMAYEVAYVLGAVLVDFEWDGDSVSRRWGDRHEERATDPLTAALDKGRTPRVLKGFRKPDLVPGSPLLLDATLTPDEFADAIAKWAEEWGRDVVVDTHPGASASAHGAMSLADVICVPIGLKTGDLNGTEQMVKEMLDYPLVLVPNMVRRVPPAAEIKRLTSIVEGTPVRVGPPIPFVGAVEVRKRRIAMTAESPVPRAILKVVDAYHDLGAFVQEYAS